MQGRGGGTGRQGCGCTIDRKVGGVRRLSYSGDFQRGLLESRCLYWRQLPSPTRTPMKRQRALHRLAMVLNGRKCKSINTRNILVQTREWDPGRMTASARSWMQSLNHSMKLKATSYIFGIPAMSFRDHLYGKTMST